MRKISDVLEGDLVSTPRGYGEVVAIDGEEVEVRVTYSSGDRLFKFVTDEVEKMARKHAVQQKFQIGSIIGNEFGEMFKVRDVFSEGYVLENVETGELKKMPLGEAQYKFRQASRINRFKVIAESWAHANFRCGGVTAGLNGHEFTLRVPRNADEYLQGLQGQPPLRSNEGMAFFYDTPVLAAFAMKTVSYPIDIIFCRGGVGGYSVGKVYSNCQPGSTDTYEYEPTSLVVEVRAGEAKARGMRVGAAVEVFGRQAKTAWWGDAAEIVPEQWRDNRSNNPGREFTEAELDCIANELAEQLVYKISDLYGEDMAGTYITTLRRLYPEIDRYGMSNYETYALVHKMIDRGFRLEPLLAA